MSKQNKINEIHNATGRATRPIKTLDEVLVKVSDDVKIYILNLYHENRNAQKLNRSLKADKRKKEDENTKLNAENIKLLLEKASVNSDRSVLSVINEELRRQLGKFYDLSVWGSVGVIFADAVADWSSVDFSERKSVFLVILGTVVRIIGGAAILFCAYMSKPSPKKKRQADAIASSDSESVS